MKLYVHGFWPGFVTKTDPVTIDFFLNLFACIFDDIVIVSDIIDECDLLLESIFSSTTYLFDKKWKNTFLFSGEPHLNMWSNYYDCVLSGFKPKSFTEFEEVLKEEVLKEEVLKEEDKEVGNEDKEVGNGNKKDFSSSTLNYVQLPLFSVFCSNIIGRTYGNWDFEPTFKKLSEVPPKGICAIISNPNGKERNEIIEKINKKFHIDFGGKYKNNVDIVKGNYDSVELHDFIRQYKFVITMENTNEEGYITEKILHSLRNGSIPIYWGTEDVNIFFNNERFINADDSEFLTKIETLMINPSLYMETVNKPIFTKEFDYGNLILEIKKCITKCKNIYIVSSSEVKASEVVSSSSDQINQNTTNHTLQNTTNPTLQNTTNDTHEKTINTTNPTLQNTTNTTNPTLQNTTNTTIHTHENPINTSNTTVLLNMIVKNEAHVIEKTLANLCDKISFHTYVISDTGSTDNTKAIIKSFFDKKGIYGEIYDDQWKDFGHNRTMALQHAFNKSDLLFIFDADDELHGAFKIPSTVDFNSYYLHFGNGYELNYWRICLINNRKRWEYVGVLHEYIHMLDNQGPPLDLYIQGNYHVKHGVSGDRGKDPDKYRKDALILENAFNKLSANDPLKTRYAFYCANSYRDIPNVDKAIEWYKRTIEMNGWVQEKYHSCLMLHNLYKDKGDIEKALFWCVNSTKFDLTRVECVFKLIQHYCCENMNDIAYNYYMLIQNWYENTYIKTDCLLMDKLFVDILDYDFYLPYYMIIVSDKVGKKEIGIKMYNMIFTKGKVASQWWIDNLTFNFQFFYNIKNNFDAKEDNFGSKAKQYLKKIEEFGLFPKESFYHNVYNLNSEM